MIFLRIEIDNFYMFKNSVLDLTYPKSVKNSTVEYEYLNGFEQFKFKRVCIIAGTNASGKTSFGWVLNSIVNYIAGRDIQSISKCIRNKNNPASFSVQFVDSTDNPCIHSLHAKFDSNGLIEETHKKTTLSKSHNYTRAKKKLENSEESYFSKNDPKHHRGINSPGFKSVAYALGDLQTAQAWNFCMTDLDDKISVEHVQHYNEELLSAFFKTFDSSIIQIEKISATSDNETKIEYRIVFKNGDNVIVSDGQVSNPSRLSRGTIEAIKTAHFALWITQYNDGLFYLDEKMAYSHTEIESCVLNFLIEKLGRRSQLFYTTHNHDILGMNLPTHSFTFMRKGEYSEILHPEKMGYTKNDRNLLNYVKNDVFGTLPNTHLIDQLL